MYARASFSHPLSNLLTCVQVGRAVALKLAIEGFDVVCCSRSDDRFDTLQTELDQLRRVSASNRNRNGIVTATTATNGNNRNNDINNVKRIGADQGGDREKSDSYAVTQHSILVGPNKGYVGIEIEKRVVAAKQVGRDRRRPVVGRLLRARRVDEGVYHRVWVIGKFDTSVR